MLSPYEMSREFWRIVKVSFTAPELKRFDAIMSAHDHGIRPYDWGDIEWEEPDASA